MTSHFYPDVGIREFSLGTRKAICKMCFQDIPIQSARLHYRYECNKNKYHFYIHAICAKDMEDEFMQQGLVLLEALNLSSCCSNTVVNEALLLFMRSGGR